MFLLATCLLCLLNLGISDAKETPRIIIVGAGASGVAAASKLYDNKFNNVLILEAENRIGGRINTTSFGEYVIDLGAQWVHGQKNNVAYELADPLGLLSNTSWQTTAYDSAGKTIDKTLFDNTFNLFESAINHANISDPYGSTGEYFDKRFTEYFKEHPEIDETLQKELLRHYDLVARSLSAADSWYEISLKGDLEYEVLEGSFNINWKERGYNTLLDILMKKIPDASEELPIVNNTRLNAKVTNIDYTGNSVKVHTSDGQEYLADHVIVTTSLGVLKKDHESLFNPPLPESKITSIKNLGFGTACKLFMNFEEPWWEYNIEWRGFELLFNETYINELEKDPNKKWVTSIVAMFAVEYKPHLLLAWVSAPGCRLMETIPDDLILEHVMDVMHTFMGKDYNITRPTAIIRSKWTQNEHFRGVYSYRTVESDKVHASAQTLSEPIMKDQTPVILFAGEATNNRQYSTVHGAVRSGWREANRIIKFHRKTSLLHYFVF